MIPASKPPFGPRTVMPPVQMRPAAPMTDTDDLVDPPVPLPPPSTADGPTKFVPPPLQSFESTHLSETLAESLIFKHLLAAGHCTGRRLASGVALPAKYVIDTLAQLKAQQFVLHKNSTTMGDFEYALSEGGRERAKKYMEECSYVGPAPVTLNDYIHSVAAQSITHARAHVEDLKRAFDGLLINDAMLGRLGPAINSGRGLFLYGAPGNGKSSIAERITACFGGTVWIPHAVFVGGELITFYDPENHTAVRNAESNTRGAPAYDARWVEIERPTIVVGGELVMESFDLRHNPLTKITEPSLQLKSNTGTLVIDDFGRQRMSPIELLNRWIVPLEKRIDYLMLANGKKIMVPFDQLIIFSTNLEPRDLVDDAFLRRIPYKINVTNPSEEEFRELFEITAPLLGVEIAENAIDRVIQKHYKDVGRTFRCCQPRDLLLQVRNLAAYTKGSAVATDEALDAACDTYFAVF